MRGEVNTLSKLAVSTPPPGRFCRGPALLPPRYSSHCSLIDSISVVAVSRCVVIDHHLNELHVDSVIMIFRHLFVAINILLTFGKRTTSVHSLLHTKAVHGVKGDILPCKLPAESSRGKCQDLFFRHGEKANIFFKHNS